MTRARRSASSSAAPASAWAASPRVCSRAPARRRDVDRAHCSGCAQRALPDGEAAPQVGRADAYAALRLPRIEDDPSDIGPIGGLRGLLLRRASGRRRALRWRWPATWPFLDASGASAAVARRSHRACARAVRWRAIPTAGRGLLAWTGAFRGRSRARARQARADGSVDGARARVRARAEESAVSGRSPARLGHPERYHALITVRARRGDDARARRLRGCSARLPTRPSRARSDRAHASRSGRAL